MASTPVKETAAIFLWAFTRKMEDYLLINNLKVLHPLVTLQEHLATVKLSPLSEDKVLPMRTFAF